MPDYGSSSLGFSPGVDRVEHVGQVLGVTMSVDTSAYGSGDLIADTQEIAGAVLRSGGTTMLQSMTVVDESDQGVAFDVYILSANVTMGTENSPPSITDGDASKIQAIIPIAAADYRDLGGVRVADVYGLNRILQAEAGSTSLFIAIVNGTGTPTFAATAIKIKLGLT